MLGKNKEKHMNKINNKEGFLLENVIIVSTQVIEAGVDIDMDVGFKDISILDSEEQFLGRINRSCLRANCHAYFFNMDITTKIYRKDKRTEYDLRVESYQSMLQDKNFESFYELCMKRLNEERKKANQKNWDNFTSKIQQPRFEEIEKHMKMIEDKPYTLFIAHMIEHITDNGESVVFDGNLIWARFKALMTDSELEFAQRRIELSRLQEQMSYFTYSYRNFQNGKTKLPHCYSVRLGDLFFVEYGEQFMTIDKQTNTKKFDRDKYMKQEESLLL
jgi:CRISPR-associated endonuclease/helicase Cas3